MRWVRVDRMMVIVVMIGFWQVVSKEVESVEGEHKKVKDEWMWEVRLEGMKLMKVQSWEEWLLEDVWGMGCDEVR